MPAEQASSPPRGGSRGVGNPPEEPAKSVFLLPVYAVAIVDPNDLDESGLPLNFGGKAEEGEVAVGQKREKLVVTRKRGAILEYDDDDPHKPTPKRLRNRMKSQKSRDKKKAYMNSLESKVKELEKTILELEAKCLVLQNENKTLKNEALETDPSVMEEMMLYYEKLREDKKNTGMSVENQEDASEKTADSREGTPGQCTEITDEQHIPEVDIDKGSSESKVDDEDVTSEMCVELDDQGVAAKFAEVDDLIECRSEINARESAPQKFDSANPPEDTLGRCFEIGNNSILGVETSLELDSVIERSDSYQ